MSATAQHRSINVSVYIIFNLQKYEFWCLYFRKTDQLKHLCCMGILTYSPLQCSPVTSDISVCQRGYFKNCIFLCNKEIRLYYFTLILWFKRKKKKKRKEKLFMINGTRRKKGRLISAFWEKLKPKFCSQLKSTQRQSITLNSQSAREDVKLEELPGWIIWGSSTDTGVKKE